MIWIKIFDNKDSAMELKNIAAFVKVHECCSFTKAAELLGYSQSAVTARIKALENELDVLLFDRLGKKISLTQHGRDFLPHAYNMLKAEQEALRSVSAGEGLHGELCICAPSSYAMAVLPDILLRFRQLHPQVSVSVRISDYPEDTTEKLARGEIDLLVCLEGQEAYHRFLTVSKRAEPLAFVTHPANPLLCKEELKLEDILTEQFILSDRDIGYCAMLEKELHKRGVELQSMMEIGSVGAIINILLKGYGTALVPRFVVEAYLERGELKELPIKDINIELYSCYLCNSQRWMSPAMSEFIRLVDENA